MPVTKAQRELVEANYGVIQSLVGKAADSTGIDRNELLTEVHHLVCANVAKANASWRFGTFVGLQVRAAIRKALGGKARRSTLYYDFQPHDSFTDDDGKGKAGGEWLSAETIPDERAEPGDDKAYIACVLGKMLPEQAELLRAFYGIGRERMTGLELAKALRVHPTTVKDRMRKARARMRELMGDV